MSYKILNPSTLDKWIEAAKVRTLDQVFAVPRKEKTVKEVFAERDDVEKKVDPLRHKLALLNAKLNELSGGKYYGRYAAVGLECCSVMEIRKLAKQVGSEEFMSTLRELAETNRDFYLTYHDVDDLSVFSRNEEPCMHNIAAMCKWLGIRPSRVRNVF